MTTNVEPPRPLQSADTMRLRLAVAGFGMLLVAAVLAAGAVAGLQASARCSFGPSQAAR